MRLHPRFPIWLTFFIASSLQAVGPHGPTTGSGAARRNVSSPPATPTAGPESCLGNAPLSARDEERLKELRLKMRGLIEGRISPQEFVAQSDSAIRDLSLAARAVFGMYAAGQVGSAATGSILRDSKNTSQSMPDARWEEVNRERPYIEALLAGLPSKITDRGTLEFEGGRVNLLELAQKPKFLTALYRFTPPGFFKDFGDPNRTQYIEFNGAVFLPPDAQGDIVIKKRRDFDQSLTQHMNTFQDALASFQEASGHSRSYTDAMQGSAFSATKSALGEENHRRLKAVVPEPGPWSQALSAVVPGAAAIDTAVRLLHGERGHDGNTSTELQKESATKTMLATIASLQGLGMPPHVLGDLRTYSGQAAADDNASLDLAIGKLDLAEKAGWAALAAPVVIALAPLAAPLVSPSMAAATGVTTAAATASSATALGTASASLAAIALAGGIAVAAGQAGIDTYHQGGNYFCHLAERMASEGAAGLIAAPFMAALPPLVASGSWAVGTAASAAGAGSATTIATSYGVLNTAAASLFTGYMLGNGIVGIKGCHDRLVEAEGLAAANSPQAATTKANEAWNMCLQAGVDLAFAVVGGKALLRPTAGRAATAPSGPIGEARIARDAWFKRSAGKPELRFDSTGRAVYRNSKGEVIDYWQPSRPVTEKFDTMRQPERIDPKVDPEGYRAQVEGGLFPTDWSAEARAFGFIERLGSHGNYEYLNARADHLNPVTGEVTPVQPRITESFNGKEGVKTNQFGESVGTTTGLRWLEPQTIRKGSGGWDLSVLKFPTNKPTLKVTRMSINPGTKQHNFSTGVYEGVYEGDLFIREATGTYRIPLKSVLQLDVEISAPGR